jgi:hypothetical protein
MIGRDDRSNDLLSRDAEAARQAKASVRARQQLIEKMIDNNTRQLRLDSAWAGADIERAGVLRDCARDAGDRGAAARLEDVNRRIAALEEQRDRLVAEREWLNKSLIDFDREAEERGADPRKQS